jgi:membrane protease YdiL (CAAX protease family)
MKSKLTRYLIEFSNFSLTRPVSDKVRVLEIIAVVLTGIGKFIFMDYLNWRLQYVIIAILVWLIYSLYRYKKDNSVLKDWGFRLDNFKSVFKLMLPIVLVSMVSFLIVGYLQSTLNLTWHILPLLIAYPIWGTVQQFLTIGLVAGNLSTLKFITLNKITVIVLTAVLFSLVHFPSNWLMIGTFILAICYAYVYLKSKNLYVLGLFHGWLGALFYYTVLDQDPFADVFLKFIH